MRILLATDHYPPFIGGAHRWAELVAHGLAQRGHHVDVVTEWHGGLARESASGAVAVHRVRQLRTAAPRLVRDPRQRHAPPFPDPIMVHDIRRLIAAIGAEVVMAHGWIAYSTAAALARTGIPLLLSAHDYGYFCATRTLLHQGAPCSGPAPVKCVRCASDFYGGRSKGAAAAAGVALSQPNLTRSIAGVQCVSAFVDDVTWRNLGAGGRRLGQVARFVIPAFLDEEPPGLPAEAERGRSLLEQLPDEPFIMFTGALRAIKGIHILLEAYERLPDPPPLVLVGTPAPDTPKVFPRGVTVLTDVPHAAVMTAWGRAMFGVVPSVWPEPLGTVSIECASQGVAVIVSVPGGMVDVVGDDAGLLVPSGDVAALAEAMATLIGNPRLRDRLGAAGRRRAARFGADVVLPEYERALAELLARRTGAAPG